MDFTFSEDQIAISDSVERIFADLCDDDTIKRLAQARTPMHSDLWKQLAESGIFALPFEEQYGGVGLSLIELCLILELQGKSVAPLPIISNVVESAMSVADSDNQALKERVLPLVCSGELILSPVRAYRGVQKLAPLQASQNADGWQINGRSGFVPYACEASAFVLSVTDQDGQDLMLLIDASEKGLTPVFQRSISEESAGYVNFEAVNVAAENLLAQGDQATALLKLQEQRTWVALAALQLGVLDQGLKRTAEYVSERKQFGRSLGSFQAVSQQAANAYMEIESLRSVYWRALDDFQEGNDTTVSAAVTKYWVAVAGHNAGHTILHLHGGIGQDLDYPIHRFFLWAKQCERYLGNADQVSNSIGVQLLASDTQQLEQLCL